MEYDCIFLFLSKDIYKIFLLSNESNTEVKEIIKIYFKCHFETKKNQDFDFNSIKKKKIKNKKKIKIKNKKIKIRYASLKKYLKKKINFYCYSITLSIIPNFSTTILTKIIITMPLYVKNFSLFDFHRNPIFTLL